MKALVFAQSHCYAPITPHTIHILALVLSAQTPVPGTPYVRTDGAITYAPLSGATLLLGDGSDDEEVTLPLPFPFLFYDQTVSSARIGANGALAFDYAGDISFSNSALGTAGGAEAIIAGFWDDLHILSGDPGQIRYLVEGVAPARSLTIEWFEVDRYSGDEPTMSWQVRLFEGAGGRLQIDYGPIDPAAMVGLSASMGMEDQLGDREILFAPSRCTTNCGLQDFLALSGRRIELIQDAGPDLSASAIVPPNAAIAGGVVSVQVTIASLHSQPIGPFRAAIELEQGAIRSPLAISAPITLAPYENRTLVLSGTADSALAPGLYGAVLIADVGQVVNEVDENNNRLTAPIRLFPPRADLAVLNASVSSTTAMAGTELTVRSLIRNNGAAQTIAGVAAVLSNNSVISPQDLVLAQENLQLAPGDAAGSTLTFTLPADLRSGRYVVGVVADPNNSVEELSELDNVRFAGTLDVIGDGVVIATERLPRAIAGEPYFAALEAIGEGSIVWSIASGVLPQGLTLSDGGVISGRAETAGNTRLVIRAESPAGRGDKSFDLEVVAPDVPLTIVSRELPDAFVSMEYELYLLATGGSGAYRWTSTPLPQGLTLREDGFLSGTPEEAATSTITFELSDGTTRASITLSLEARALGFLAIDPIEPPTGVLQAEYLLGLTATGGVEPYRWRVIGGELPAGLALDPAGTISGQPQLAGEFFVVVEVEDAIGSRDRASLPITITDFSPFRIATETLPDGFVREAYDVRVEARDGTPPFTWTILEGTLPAGLSAAGENNVLRIAGTPEVEETRTLFVEVRDAQGRNHQRPFALRVLRAELGTAGDGGCRTSKAHGTGGLWINAALLAMLVFARRGRR